MKIKNGNSYTFDKKDYYKFYDLNNKSTYIRKMEKDTSRFFILKGDNYLNIKYIGKEITLKEDDNLDIAYFKENTSESN